MKVKDPLKKHKTRQPRLKMYKCFIAQTRVYACSLE